MATFEVQLSSGRKKLIEAHSMYLDDGNYVFREKSEGMAVGAIVASIPEKQVQYASRVDNISDAG